MKRRTYTVIAAAAALAYIIAKDKARKKLVRRLIEESAFEKYRYID